VTDDIILIVVRGVGLGGIFALLALGLNVIYNATHILNFAQGAMFVLGGLMGVAAAEWGYGSAPWMLAMVGAGFAIAAVMAVQGWITLLPLRESTQQHSWLITTLAVSIIISALLLLLQGPWTTQITSPIPSFTVRGMRTPVPYLVLPVLAIAWYIALRCFARWTLTGLALTAISQDLEAAAAAGLKVRRLQVLSFAISGLIAGTAGFAAAPIISLAPDAGLRYVVAGFVAAVVGGMGSMIGAMVCSPIIGLIAMLAVYGLGGKYEGFVSLIILSLMLAVRPAGLFGAHALRRV
jgi:branched-chain amino acid transport system permease protein